MCIGTGLSINGRTLGFDRPIGGYFLIPIINALSTPKFVHFFLKYKRNPKLCLLKKKGVPSAVGFPHCAGSGEGLFLSPKPYAHKCAEAGARTRELPVTDGRLYRCTRPALLKHHKIDPQKKV